MDTAAWTRLRWDSRLRAGSMSLLGTPMLSRYRHDNRGNFFYNSTCILHVNFRWPLLPMDQYLLELMRLTKASVSTPTASTTRRNVAMISMDWITLCWRLVTVTSTGRRVALTGTLAYWQCLCLTEILVGEELLVHLLGQWWLCSYVSEGQQLWSGHSCNLCGAWHGMNGH